MSRSPGTERINLPWVVGSWAAGAILIVASFWMEHFHAWVGVSLETMTSVGSALLLAGVIFFLQKRFLVEIEERTSQTAIEAADARIDQRVREFDVRLDELDERMNQAWAERRGVQDATIEAMSSPTFYSVANALAVANKAGAIAYGRVTVQASRDLDELGLEFSWGTDLGDGRRGQERRDLLLVQAHVYANERGNGINYVIETEWDPTDTAIHVGERLRDLLENRGSWKGDQTLQWPTALRNLQRSLDIATRSRRKDHPSDWTIEGALFELIGDDWAITDAGLECPSRGFILRESSFPEENLMTRRAARSAGREPWQPEQPDWVDDLTWNELVLRGKRHFPIHRGPMIMQPSWIPLTEGPVEMDNQQHA